MQRFPEIRHAEAPGGTSIEIPMMNANDASSYQRRAHIPA
jgi:hypothetical protein